MANSDILDDEGLKEFYECELHHPKLRRITMLMLWAKKFEHQGLYTTAKLSRDEVEAEYQLLPTELKWRDHEQNERTGGERQERLGVHEAP